jgi:hypothetical protein
MAEFINCVAISYLCVLLLGLQLGHAAANVNLRVTGAVTSWKGLLERPSALRGKESFAKSHRDSLEPRTYSDGANTSATPDA